jgi:uncharacterized protein with FMN-binding domain
MKRALLIAGGTVGGLGAVLAITPPQLSSGDLSIAGGTAIGSVSSSASASSSPTAVASQTATKGSKPVATKKATAAATAAASGTAATTEPAPQAPAVSTTAVSTTAVSGTFTGPSVFVNYGNVQVQITVVNGRITDAVAVKAPSGKNDRYTNMSVPTLKQQTLAAQSANIKGVSGASYTSYGWFTSLQGALADAGL